MPFANLKVPAGLLTPAQKEELVTKVTDMDADTFGDDVRANTVLTLARLRP